MAARTIAFDSFTLRAVVAELREWLVGARVQHLGQPSPAEVVLTVRAPGSTRFLLISWHARFARAHAVNTKPTNLPEAPAFCMALRKHLLGAVVSDVRQDGFDRILLLEFHRHEARVRMVAELMGKHSNLVLMDEAGTIIDCAKHVGPRLNRFRVILPNHGYDQPPRRGLSPLVPEARDALASIAMRPRDEWRAALTDTFEGMSPVLVAELVYRAGALGLAGAHADLLGGTTSGSRRPVVVRDPDGSIVGAYPLPLMSMAECKNEPADSVNAAVEEAFNARTALEAGATSSKRLASDIAAAVAARRGQIATALAWEREAAGADRLRQLGDNVLAAGDSIVLTNGCAIAPDLYGDGGPAAIAAEPGQPPRAIADGLYKRSRKLLAGVERQRERRRLAEEEIGALQDALHSMDGEGDARRILEIRRTLMAANLLRPEQAEGQARPSRSDEEATRGVRRYRTRDGWEVLLGINAEGNDALLRMCSPDDLWFHVRSGRSAHVAIRTAGRPGKVPPATIRFAALMTARHSRAKHSSMVPVDYTERKHVRRRKGTAHGSVTYRNERTLDVCPDTEAEDAATD